MQYCTAFFTLFVVVMIYHCPDSLSASVPNFQCYTCFPDGPNMQKCNEPQESQLRSCPPQPDGTQVCWMTMQESADKSLIVSRGCGRAMEAPDLRNDGCKKTRDRASGSTEQICNCNTPKCNKNNCKSKSKCFI